MKKNCIIPILTILILLLDNSAFAQNIGLLDIKSSDTLQISKGKHGNYKHVISDNDSEYKLALNTLFLFYKGFVSSQDGSNCNFTPSCSEYAVLAVKQKGLLKGTAMFFDRYTRCNSMNREFYKVDRKKLRLIDPVQK